jgi:hypothetical protein
MCNRERIGKFKGDLTMPTREIADPATDRPLFTGICTEERSFAQVSAPGIACRLGARSGIGVALFVFLVVSLEFFLPIALAAEYKVTILARRSSDINRFGSRALRRRGAIPNAFKVTALGITNSGQIVGYYSSPAKVLAFLTTGDSVPIAIDGDRLCGKLPQQHVNNFGYVVGSFHDIRSLRALQGVRASTGRYRLFS